MSTSNKRFIDDDQFRPSFIPSNSSIKKRRCLSLVPSVPRGGNTFPVSPTNNSKGIPLDAGDVKNNLT
jgi:hypothetical protein